MSKPPVFIDLDYEAALEAARSDLFALVEVRYVSTSRSCAADWGCTVRREPAVDDLASAGTCSTPFARQSRLA